MGEFKGFQRLLVVITEGFPKDFLSDWVTNLPYLGTHFYQGFSAIIKLPLKTSAEDIWSYFKSGSSDPENQESFLKEVETRGKKVEIFSKSRFLPGSNQFSGGDMRDLIIKQDWHLFIASVPLEEDEANSPKFDSDIEYYRGLDKSIENIALSVDSQTVVMVLSLPDRDKDGWLISGGAQIAAVGSPGMIELIDIPKTILWLLGIDIPEYMDGRLLEEILDTDLELSQEEMDLLTDHLRGLGYLG